MGRHSSRRRATRAFVARAPCALGLLSALVAVALLGGAGCGRSGVSRPAPPDPGIVRGEPARRLDPSEEITPEELASIPEPLPALSSALKGAQDQPMEGVAQPPSEAPSGAFQTPVAASPQAAAAPVAQVWRVQVYASDRREEAERVSREAAQALAVAGSVEREGALYKVRLGRFATEAEAQALRERAIQAGYPGAFRIKIAP